MNALPTIIRPQFCLKFHFDFSQVDYTIMRKRLEMQESLKRPQKIKKKLRLFITNSYYPANPQQSNSTGNWELRVEGRLLEQESLNR